MNKESKVKREIDKINPKIEKLKGRIYDLRNDIPTEKFRIRSHMYLGSEEFHDGSFSYTYEITFNDIIPDTGVFSMMEEGINEGIKKRDKLNAKKDFKLIPCIIKRFFTSLITR